MAQRSKSDVDLFWRRLEAERHDLTWKRPQQASCMHEPQIIVRTVRERPSKVERDKRDKLMFNAGRYAAGARDKTATAAHEALLAEEEKKGN